MKEMDAVKLRAGGRGGEESPPVEIQDGHEGSPPVKIEGSQDESPPVEIEEKKQTPEPAPSTKL